MSREERQVPQFSWTNNVLIVPVLPHTIQLPGKNDLVVWAHDICFMQPQGMRCGHVGPRDQRITACMEAASHWPSFVLPTCSGQ